MDYFKEQTEINSVSGSTEYHLGVMVKYKGKIGLSVFQIKRDEIDSFIEDLEFVRMSDSLPIFEKK